MVMLEQQQQLSLEVLPGDWPEALCRALRVQGFASATAYAETQPTMSLEELAGLLGADVTAIQLERKLVVEAEQSGSIERCARCLLVRKLRHAVPEGWPREWTESPEDVDGPLFRRAAVFLSLEMSLPEGYELAVNRIRRVMDTADILAGWLPDGPDDPVLIEMFGHWEAPAL